jgi:sigma-B regulation protein RsbU (phosphoserine phosphatase)
MAEPFFSIDSSDTAYEQSPCGLATLRHDGRISCLNQTLAGWLELPKEKVIGKRLYDLFDVAGRMVYETHLGPLLLMHGGFSEVSTDLLSASGRKLPVIAYAKQQKGNDGQVLLTHVVFTEGPLRRRYEEQLVDARTRSTAAEEAARQALLNEREVAQLREQFIAVLGHDLRNPLASIDAGARILSRSPRNEEDTLIIDMLGATVSRMAGLINDVMDFARGRLGGGITLSRDASKPLEPVLTQVVNELRGAYPDRAIETDFSIAVPVDCDRSRLGQLASNLLGNALAHGEPNQPVRVGASTLCGSFELWVANGGDPIPESQLDDLFEPFVRGKGSEGKEGLGLGLYIASQIAQAHDGTLSVASNADETRFTFRMPLRVR